MKITTTENGYLAQSFAFKNLVKESNFEVHPTTCNFIDHLMPDQVDVYITTDDNGKLSHSHGFCCTANDN